MYGSILPTMSSIVRTGVVIRSSRLPRSRSRTMATDVKSASRERQYHADEPRHDHDGGALLRIEEGPRRQKRARRRGCNRGARAERHGGEPRCDAGDQRVRAVDEELRGRPVRIGEPALQILWNMKANDDLVALHGLLERLDRARLCDDIDDLGRRKVSEELARELGAGLVDDAGSQMAHIEIDRESEQHDENQRNADDHAEGQAVARELPDLLARDREYPLRNEHVSCDPWRRRTRLRARGASR